MIKMQTTQEYKFILHEHKILCLYIIYKVHNTIIINTCMTVCFQSPQLGTIHDLI